MEGDKWKVEGDRTLPNILESRGTNPQPNQWPRDHPREKRTERASNTIKCASFCREGQAKFGGWESKDDDDGGDSSSSAWRWGIGLKVIDRSAKNGIRRMSIRSLDHHNQDE